MQYGPVHPILSGLATGFNPVKTIKVSSNTGKQTVLFDQDYPYALQSSPVEVDADTVIYEATPAAAIVRLTQMIELAQNAEWQRCGFFIQWREDGINDPEDGWYIIRPHQVSEDLIFSGYAEPTISVDLRARQRSSIGVYVDSKLVPNDSNQAGVTLAALPMGMSTQYPAATWTFAGSNGNILVIENAPSILRATLSAPTTVMTQGRCRVSDQTANRATQTEVFWKDHRNVNNNWEISNDLCRYYFGEGSTAPSIDVWDVNTAGWVTMGNYQLQVTNTGPVLPLQTVKFQTISPEEVIWTEWRYDSAGTALVVVTNRVRRGSRLIESTIVAASGAGLTGTQSVGIVSAPNVAWTIAPSADIQGVIFTDGFETAGSTATLTHSLGTDARGTLADWNQVAGVWAIAANVVTSPTAIGNLMVTGHPDSWDGTFNQRVKWVTGNAFAAVVHCDGTDNNWIAGRIDGANLHIDKRVAGTYTSDVIAATACALTTGNQYWIQVTPSGTTYTVKVFNDNAGAINLASQVGSTMTTTISDASVQTGFIGLRNFAANAFTAAGAFNSVCTWVGPVPALNGVSYSPTPIAGEPAFCWSKVNPQSGTYSLSIYNAASGDDGSWAIPSIAVTNGQAYVMTTGVRVTGNGTAQFSNNVNFNTSTAGPAPPWQNVSMSGPATVSSWFAVLRLSGQTGISTAYFDNASISAGGTGVVFTSTSKLLPGFAYLTQNVNAPTSPSNTTIYSGITVPAGTIARFAIICGDQDAQYTSLATGAAYAGRWASYGRQRVRQKILTGLAA